MESVLTTPMARATPPIVTVRSRGMVIEIGGLPVFFNDR
jgi:hypothetical protein